MKDVKRCAVVAALSAIVTLGVSKGFAEKSDLDPVLVAPEEFTTVFENERVRVVRVSVADGSQPARHSHPDRVVVFVNDCTWLESSNEGAILEETYAAGEVSWQEATIHESHPNRVKNTCELLEVELK